MNIASTRITGRAWPAAAALALLLAPICVRADDVPSDRHEIPTFVLKRTELATGADVSARVPPAATATTAEVARPRVTQ